MVQITAELLRKRAEHHDRELAPLEEIALHQESIEKIDYIADYCPKLTILLLQSNIISKIENLHKLKYLQYLNLALNNIEVIENLERCESLNKLDLTLNFVGKLDSVQSLENNYALEHLYLTGNPCTDYEGYKDYVIAVLPQLETLDGSEVSRSQRINALQHLSIIRPEIYSQQYEYRQKRLSQKMRLEKEIGEKWKKIDYDDEEESKKFWNEKCEHSPEVRIEMERHRQLQKEKLTKDEKKEPKKPRNLFASDGRAFNVNQPKVPFQFNDDEDGQFTLDIAVYKYMETSLLDVDIQPKYVRITMKGKIFQLCLPEEVDISASTAQRSQITGHLVIVMPKMNGAIKTKKKEQKVKANQFDSHDDVVTSCVQYNSKREYLEIGSSQVLDFTDLTKPEHEKSNLYNVKKISIPKTKLPSENFVDDESVPCLI